MNILNNFLNSISKILLDSVKNEFILIELKTEIHNDNCGGFYKFSKTADGNEHNILLGWDRVDKLNETIISLRDQILAETGKRIWGLTFTLYPDGKYEIEYDYNVPEGFNEKGEYIGEECSNETVKSFFDNIRNIGTDESELK